MLLTTQDYIRDPANQDEVPNIFADFQDQPLEMKQALLDPSIRRSTRPMSRTCRPSPISSRTNRNRDRRDVLSDTYSDQMAAYDPALVEVEGQWKP